MIDVILRIIREKDFSKFIGLKENLWFEAKGRMPYRLELPSGRYELAKDVTAFANAEGGHIVIGLTHKPLENEMTEEISAVEMIAEAEFDSVKYLGLIKHYIYPQIDGLSITWQDSAIETGKGLGVIFVPPQKETKKYFLITRGVIEDEEELKANIVGIIKRRGTRNTPISGKEIYEIMQKGKSDTAQRLSGIESMLTSMNVHISSIAQKVAFINGETQNVQQVSFEKLYDAIKRATE